MANPVVGIDVEAAVEQFRSKMASMPGTTAKEVKAMAAELNRSLKASTKATQAAAKEQRAAIASVAETMEESAGTAGQSAAKIAGFAEAIVPGSRDALMAVNDLGDAIEGLGLGAKGLGIGLGGVMTVVGALSVAAGAAYLSFRALNDEEDRAAAISAKVTEARAAHVVLIDKQRTAALSLAEVTGQLSAQEVTAIKAGMEAHSAYLQATEKTRARLVELRREQSSLWTQTVDGVSSTLQSASSAWNPLATAASFYFDMLTTSSSDLRREETALQGTLVEAIDKTEELSNTLVSLAQKQSQAARLAVDDTLAAAKAAQSSADAMAARIEAVTRAQADAAKLASGAFATDDAESRLWAERERLLGDYAALAEAGGVLAADRAAATAAIEIAYLEAVTDARAVEAAKREDIAAREAEAEMRAAASVRDSWIGFGLAATQAFSDLAEMSVQTADTSTAAGKRAAKQAFATQKALALGTAAVLAIQAVMQAAASAPPPANIPAILAASVGGAVSIGKIASQQPTFHRGGLAPDEQTTRVLAGEEVVSRQGRSAASVNNAGQVSAQSVTVNLRLRHQIVDRIVAEVMGSSGETRRMIDKEKKTPFGHRKY